MTRAAAPLETAAPVEKAVTGRMLAVNGGAGQLAAVAVGEEEAVAAAGAVVEAAVAAAVAVVLVVLVTTKAAWIRRKAAPKARMGRTRPATRWTD